jgi:simple sugar transport system ATP-binding protein
VTDDLLRLRKIDKRFVGVHALKGVDFALRSGEIRCLVGENGSGKSTLIKIISGVEQPDAGEIWVDDERVATATANEMIHRGVQVIYQDLSLFPNLTVAENVAMPHVIEAGHALIDWRDVKTTARTALKRISADIDPEAIVGELPVGLQQMVAICRALTRDPKLLILDEPTASLTKVEIDQLLSVVDEMKRRGIAIIFITHKLDEVLKVADTVTGLRDGKIVGTFDRVVLDHDKLVEIITGRPVDQSRFNLESRVRKKLLEVKGLSKRFNFADISFDLSEGEIVGIAGVIGSGRTELALALFGVAPADSGSIRVDGVERTIASVQDAVAAGFACVPESRLTQGLALKRSVGDNLIAAAIERCVGRFRLLDSSRRRTMIAEGIERLAIKAKDPDVAVETLSGGNQQRVVIGKWLAARPQIFILDGPTVGVDVAAKSAIHRIVRGLAADGAGVMLISDEAPELVRNTNRILLMRGGRIRAEILSDAVTPERLQSLVEAA